MQRLCYDGSDTPSRHFAPRLTFQNNTSIGLLLTARSFRYRFTSLMVSSWLLGVVAWAEMSYRADITFRP